MFFRSILGSFLALLALLTLNACGTSQPAQTTSQATIRGTVVDSTTGRSLDSAQVLVRRRGDTLQTGSGGGFTLEGMPPGLYVFDVNAYGYHPHRHVSALVRSGGSDVDLSVPLLPQTLQVDCENRQQGYHRTVQSFVDQDSSAVRFRLIDLFAQDGEVRVQPILRTQVSAPIFLPDSLGPRSHYDVELVDETGDPLPFHYKNERVSNPDLHRIYQREDILVVVPQQATRLAPKVLQLEEEVAPGTPVYARVRYQFSLRDTLRPTPQTDFPEERLDSLQVARYDTLRVGGSLIAPDSLVERRDTTIVRTVGLDTTVTRDGYLLYSTERDTNAFANAQGAVRELYVPDSVKARTRLDSLIAAGVDTVRTQPEAEPTPDPDARRAARSPIDIVLRSDRRALDSLVVDNNLARVLEYGIPRPGMSLDSLELLTDSSLAATLSSPRLERRPLPRTVPRPDSVLRRYSADSLTTVLTDLVRDSLVVDSLVQRRQPDAPSPAPGADSVRAPGDAAARADSLAVPSPAEDSVSADTPATDPLAADTLAADSVNRRARADTTQPERPRLRSDTLTVGDRVPDTVSTDSIRAYLTRAGVETDSVVVDSTIGSFLDDPPAGTYRYVPGSKTRTGERVLVLDPAFTRVRAPVVLDTARVEDLLTLTPERVGDPPEPRIERVVQQIILVPTGGYRTRYLETWRAEQQKNLRDPYCEIFRLRLRSSWRSTTMR